MQWVMRVNSLRNMWEVGKKKLKNVKGVAKDEYVWGGGHSIPCPPLRISNGIALIAMHNLPLVSISSVEMKFISSSPGETII